MKHPLLLFLFLTQPLMSHATPCSSFARWSHGSRPLLIFSPSPSNPGVISQRRLLAAPTAPATLADYQIPILDASIPYPGAPVCAQDISSLRRRFHIDPADFTVILLGKDGGEKLRLHKPVTLKALTDLIDTMPMRRQETRDGSH